MRPLACSALLALAFTACEDKRTMKTIPTVSAPPPSAVPAAPSVSASAAHRDPSAAVAVVCRRLLECRGEDASAAEETTCEQNFLQQAKDEEAKDSLAAAFDEVAVRCKSIPCDKYADCYMDALQAQMGSGPPPKVDPQLRGRFVASYCLVVSRSRGMVPDINAPDAPPEVQELRKLAMEIDQRAIPDLMKEGLAACTVLMQATQQPAPADAGAKKNGGVKKGGAAAPK